MGALIVSQAAEQYKRYAADAQVLAGIGSTLQGQTLHPVVHVPTELAEAATKAWGRDEPDHLPSETAEQTALRRAAGDLALIGLAIAQNGQQRAGGIVEVKIDPTLIDAAVRAYRRASPQ